jgi:cell division protein FtsZ
MLHAAGQQAVHPDALTIFGATFDDTMDDEIRVTVIATGFDAADPQELKPTVAAPAEEPAAPTAPAETAAPAAPAAPAPLDVADDPKETFEDPFEDIFKIFQRRD